MQMVLNRQKLLNQITASQGGAAFLMVLVFLLLGCLLIVPLLSMVDTGLQTGLMYEKKNGDLFAADAGIQDATWYIKYGYLYSLPVSPAYNVFDFNTSWDYSLPQQVNNREVKVTLENIWVPNNIAVPDESTASSIITAEKLMVTGSATETTGKITLTYTPLAGEDLMIETVGVWLPRGFSYTTGSSNLESDPDAPYYSVPSVQSHDGNQAILWSFNSVSFNDFPGVDPLQFPVVSEITFQFTSSVPGAKPNIVSWVTTSGVADIPFSWDADTSVYHITSRAGNTVVEIYTYKEEIRHLRSAVPGDYVAIGNSLMVDTNHDSHGIRDHLLPGSDAAVSSIPSDATVGAAYLYWSAWLDDSHMQTVLWDSCFNFGNWVSGSTWNINNGTFRSHYSSGEDSSRYNTLKFGRDLSSYTAGTVKISWDQWTTALTDLFNDSCNSFTNWINGSAWSVYGGDYFRGHYTSGDDSVKLLTLKNNQNLSSYDDGTVQVSWDQWVSPLSDIFSDSCYSFNNWNNGAAWGIYNNRFRGQYSSGGDATRLLSLKNSQNLSSFAGGSVKISWDQWVSSGDASPADGLDFALSADGGTTWSNNITAFRGNISSATNFSYNIPSQYLTNNFKIRFMLVGFNTPGPYGNIDNIKITPSYSASDGLDFAFSADGGATWSNNIQAFRGDIGNSPTNFSYTIPEQYLTSTFKMRFYVVGMSGSGKYADIEHVKITPAYDASDGLDFAFSADGGATWSNNISAFRGDIGDSPTNFSYTIPGQYLSNNFKVRFYLVGMGGTGEYANQDNIKLSVMSADTSITFKIDGSQVYFDGSGQPAQGSQPITAESAQVFAGKPGLGGFSYACYKDVTSLVRTYSAKAPDPAVNHPGNGTYNVGDVLGDTDGEISYAGWSLIVVYTSGATWGHQLYLYDRFSYSPGYTDLDFDNDGMPGGYISGFIVPNQMPGEEDAAKLTVFVGEGDDCWPTDFVAFNAPASYQSHPQDIPDSYKLWDGTYSTEVPGSNTSGYPNNIWNGDSVGLTADGVDIDTLNIPWDSGMLQTGDTSARIDLYSVIDNWNLVYIIVSFRSSVTTGNALNYLIR